MAKTLDYVAPGPDTGGWKARHVRAVWEGLVVHYPSSTPIAIVQGMRAWLDYTDAHHSQYESPIGEDYVLGPAWADWGKALRVLLNGETGGLDCGTLDTIIADNLREQGFEV